MPQLSIRKNLPLKGQANGVQESPRRFRHQPSCLQLTFREKDKNMRSANRSTSCLYDFVRWVLVMKTYGFESVERTWAIAEAAAQVVALEGKPALRLENGVVWLRQEVAETSLRLRTTIRSVCGAAFAGIAFYGRDDRNYELVYACIPSESGVVADGLQYDPVMGGSNTWQLFHGQRYQGAARLAPGTCHELEVRVESDSVEASIDGVTGLRVARLQLEKPGRRIGLWVFKPALFTGLDVQTSRLSRLARRASGAPLKPIWSVAMAPSATADRPLVDVWREAREDETGILNLNRLFPFEVGASALVRASWDSPVPYTGVVRLGYSDRCRAWWNGALIHEGEHRWDPPTQSDGRVRPERIVPVSVREGRNTLVANVGVLEPFGWGIAAALNGRAVRV